MVDVPCVREEVVYLEGKLCSMILRDFCGSRVGAEVCEGRTGVSGRISGFGRYFMMQYMGFGFHRNLERVGCIHCMDRRTIVANEFL